MRRGACWRCWGGGRECYIYGADRGIVGESRAIHVIGMRLESLVVALGSTFALSSFFLSSKPSQLTLTIRARCLLELPRSTGPSPLKHKVLSLLVRQHLTSIAYKPWTPQKIDNNPKSPHSRAYTMSTLSNAHLQELGRYAPSSSPSPSRIFGCAYRGKGTDTRTDQICYLTTRPYRTEHQGVSRLTLRADFVPLGRERVASTWRSTDRPTRTIAASSLQSRPSFARGQASHEDPLCAAHWQVESPLAPLISEPLTAFMTMSSHTHDFVYHRGPPDYQSSLSGSITQTTLTHPRSISIYTQSGSICFPRRSQVLTSTVGFQRHIPP